ncbi:MAG: hypothetical protein ETSY1_19030 [Candidatus Entotheonella factor]|uniref:RNA polymerase sigma factor n=2 Tax=Candidatus Entotheonella TaxID=93171 RepID=W4LLZ7_ENTF1|nr:MAG: hypothetical protein ETSY1_19030 [Candidatus Entotheonella factor]
MHRVATGDLAAFEALYQHYTPWLMQYLQSRLEQAESAEDVCQDVFLAVWNQASIFPSLSPLSTWILEMAQQHVLKVHTRDMYSAHEVVKNEPESGAEDPAENCCRQSDNRRVNQAVTALPPVLRQTITLRFYHDYSYREIATQMGCAEVTVKNRLRQARRRLGAALRRRKPPEVTAM